MGLTTGRRTPNETYERGKAHHESQKKLYGCAEWAKIGERITQEMSPWKEIRTRLALDTVVEKLTKATAQAVDQFTPDSRLSPYAIRWFTPSIKSQQIEFNQVHRRWQTSCAELGRNHASSLADVLDMQWKRLAWTRNIEKAKASHWK
jgi:hypothetical protein